MPENNQYTTSKVQSSDFTKGWKIAVLIAGTGVSLPVLFLGSEIALKLGFNDALIAFAVSTLALSILCCLTTLIGTRSRLSTYMILQFSFGTKGSFLINLIFALTLLGWFSVSLELLAVAVKDTVLDLFNYELAITPIIILSGIGMLITTSLGIKSIEKLSNYTVPFLFFFLFYALYKTVNQDFSMEQIMTYVPPIDDRMTIFEGTAALIGGAILFPVLMADFSRFIETDKQSLFSVLGIALGTPLVLIVAGIMSIDTGEIDIMKIMSSLGMVVSAFFILITSSWILNVINLYSSILTMSTFNEEWSFRNLAIIGGILGIGLALLGFTDYFISFLNVLGVVCPSISAIYILDFYWVHKGNYDLKDRSEYGIKAIVSWSVASVIALLTYLEVFTLTGAFFIDSILIAALLYFLLKYRTIQQ